MKVNKEGAEYYQWGNNCDGWHLLKQPQLSIIQEHMPPGTQEVRHYHKEAEQFFFVLDGELCIEIDGDVHNLNPKEGLHIPSKASHQVRNDSEKAVEFLVVSAPPGHGDRVKL